MAGSVVLGVIRDVNGVQYLHHVANPPAVTPEILELARGARVTDVFRFAAPCAGAECSHFVDDSCRLATKIAATVEETVAFLPPCAIRAECRWFSQEGRRACLRCPLIFSEMANPSEALTYAADPSQ
jgi:hypothetical protein